MNLKQLLFIGWIIGFGALSVQAQQGNNPFEIAGSTAADSMEQTELLQGDNPFLLNNQESATSNPFELSSPAKTQGVGGREDFRPEQAIENRPGLNFQFLFFSGLLIFLAVMLQVLVVLMKRLGILLPNLVICILPLIKKVVKRGLMDT